MDRRQFLIGSAAVASATLVPTVAAAAPVAVSPPVIHPVWAVGTEGGRDWQLLRAPALEDAIAEWRGIWGDPCDCDPENEDCEDCCAKPEAFRVKALDDKLETTARNRAHHIAGWMGTCERCNWDECDPSDYNVLPDDELVCDECMTLADWRVTNPKHYEELCDELLTDEYGPDLRYPQWW